MSENSPLGGGGAATAGGMDFQHRVAAWMAVRILAEQDANPPWDLPANTAFEFLRCETELPVDDLLVGTSDGGFIFVQVKRRLSVSAREDSDLASTIGQFVRQFLACRTRTGNSLTWEGPIDPVRSRLLLATTPHASAGIRDHLPAVLSRLKSLVPGQTIEDAAVNQAEKRALNALLKHLRRIWKNSDGSLPTEEDIKKLLALVRVESISVERGGTEETAAKSLLRQAVLQDPTRADTAWQMLIEACAGFAQNRSGADRNTLQQLLLNAGIPLKAPRSYRSSIEKLRNYSRRTTELLARLSRVEVGSTRIKINRQSVEYLRRVADEGSVLVVGDPGAGKSGALFDFVEKLGTEGKDVIFLAVDRLDATTLSRLRSELNLEHDLLDVLLNWLGTKSGFLVIDALDAARMEPAARTLRDLMAHVLTSKSRWRVVASIRKFDLRYSEELRELFRGRIGLELSPEFTLPEFKELRHLNVPRFSPQELAQIPPQSPLLQDLIRTASTDLHELLRVPFNLRLLAELLGAGVDTARLSPIRTQLELLNSYWKHRVIREDDHGDARETLLKRACEEMVRGRVLRVDRSYLAEPQFSPHLRDLLSVQVLIEWQTSPTVAPDRYILTFSHHALFDYAIERLLLRGAAATLIKRLNHDPELTLVVRPSLILHFQYLWMLDEQHVEFWKLALTLIQLPKFPEIGKLIGPLVAAESANRLEDLEIFCTALESSNENASGSAEQVLKHLVGALLVNQSTDRPLVEAAADPWFDLLERVSRSLRDPIAFAIRPLLSTLCTQPYPLTPEQRVQAGKSARRLLEFAWSRPSRDKWMVNVGIQCVCRTLESDLRASTKLLGRLLESQHLHAHGFEEMYRLADEIERLMPLDPEFVEQVYAKAFEHREDSNEPTPIGDSQILPFTSTKGQDFHMALYKLAEEYPRFLAHAPAHATRALIAVLEAHVARKHTHNSSRATVDSFHFNNHIVTLHTDYSSIWDAGDSYRDDEPLKILDAFDKHLSHLAKHGDDPDQLRNLLTILTTGNRLAVLWRRLLLLGSRFPESLVQPLKSLAWAMPILTGYDTSLAAGEFIRAAVPRLSSEERELVERAILSIPDSVPTNLRGSGENIRDRLLACLFEEHLVTDQARRLLEELRVVEAMPANRPADLPARVLSVEEDYLARVGVPVDAEPNRRVRDLEEPVQQFAKKYGNSPPSGAEASLALRSLQALWNALVSGDTISVHPKQLDHAWDDLASACSCIAEMEELSCEDQVGLFVKEALLKASRHSDPEYIPQNDAQFDDRPSWVSPSARIQAAKGIVALCRHVGCATTEVLQAIERLSSDPVPAVRFQVAGRLSGLYRTAPDRMWTLIEHFAREERSLGVLQGFLGYTLNGLAGAYPERVTLLGKGIFERINDGPGAAEVRRLCISLFANLYVWRDVQACREIILEITADPGARYDDAQTILSVLREPMTHGPTKPPEPFEGSVRHRAFVAINNLVTAAAREFHVAVDKTARELSESEQTRRSSIVRLIDRIGSEIYFASGSFEHGRRSLSREAQERFYSEFFPIVDQLLSIGIPSLAHHLLEMLETFITFDPVGVFLKVGRVVRGGQQWGYQYESLAANLVVQVVERYLAEYRELLRDNVECQRTLMEVLDTFVGWPNARQLTYRLEEIFR